VDNELQEHAPAKLNLYLHITDKRPDGYHLLDSMVVFPDIADTIKLVPSKRLSLTITGPYAHELSASEDNLIMKAARLLNPAYGAALTLIKNLPIASGIGGGSADAAATLRLLNDHWKLNLPDDELMRLALSLGADVPVCLKSQSCIMRGIGEVISTAPKLPNCGIILINPNVSVSTAHIFKSLTSVQNAEASCPPDELKDYLQFINFLSGQRNDMQDAAIAIAPEIQIVLDALAVNSDIDFLRMSGSGATCFGITETPEQAHKAANNLKELHPNWWVANGSI